MEIKVTLPHHSYLLQIQAGLLDRCGEWVKSLWQPQRIVIVTDENVNSLYGQKVLESVQQAGFEASLAVVPAGETSKSLTVAEDLYGTFLEAGLTRSDGVIALGGGVIGDLAGFVASTYLRGVHFLQIPTTLLAQVDSSIGGKTAVNLKQGKNMVGTFSQPDGVLIDPLTLNTLEPRRVREGIAEVVKSAAIADLELWELLVSLEDEADLLKHAEAVISACCEVKRKVVEEDELDTGNRLKLNFGHTIGHAIEQVAGYGVCAHGEAVSIGMVQMNQVAEAKGLTAAGTTVELVKMLTKFHLPIEWTPWEPDQLLKAMVHDKKASGDSVRIIQLKEIGEATILRIPISELSQYLVRPN
ncbi:3-dehydroquinate synthase [Carnobacterium gallinarum]|uniref:3-dehydroquinate synthase n=1 Tax=Carnobacterium gallinarum TaxID=2749 RepID=UPI000555F3C3|nr:3-dehydroquinate synthase [Carnobacterium gallinarum]